MPAKRATAAAAARPPSPPPSPSSSSESGDGDGAGAGGIFFDTHYSSKFMSSLPAALRTRARVLLHYHDEYMKLQEEAERAETALRRQYEALYAPLLRRRREIVAGGEAAAAVSDAEVRAGYPDEHAGKVSLTSDKIDDDEDEAEKAATANDNNKEDGAQPQQPKTSESSDTLTPTTTTTTTTDAVAAADKDTTGLPGFWLRVLQHHVMFEHLIQPHDEPVLRHLTDVTSHITDGEYGSFAVVFTFAPNEYLSSTELRLEVRITDGTTTIVRTPPTWRPGKNVTVRRVAQKQRSRRTGRTRTIMREETQPSFFALFSEPRDSSSDDDDDDDDDHHGGKKTTSRSHKTAARGGRQRHHNDDEDDDEDDDGGDDNAHDNISGDVEQMVQLLQLLHTQMIPGAVEYYTGEAADGSSDVEGDDDDDEYDDDDDDDDDDDSDE